MNYIPALMRKTKKRIVLWHIGLIVFLVLLTIALPWLAIGIGLVIGIEKLTSKK